MAEFEQSAPIKQQWIESKEPPQGNFIKEMPGNKALFHWHCGCRMRRIILYEKRGGIVRKVGLLGWICEVCDARETPMQDPF